MIVIDVDSVYIMHINNHASDCHVTIVYVVAVLVVLSIDNIIKHLNCLWVIIARIIWLCPVSDWTDYKDVIKHQESKY